MNMFNIIREMFERYDAKTIVDSNRILLLNEKHKKMD